MIALMNSLACILALGSAVFLWRAPLKLFTEVGKLLAMLLIFGVFSFFTLDALDCQLESYPFRMFALAICCSTTSLTKNRKRYLVLAQLLWLWVELFGGISLFYRGFEMPWLRIFAISVGALGSCFLSRISRGMEFALMVYWIAVWIFF